MTDSREFEFLIKGMHCAEEVAMLKKELGKLVDVDSQLEFDILNRRLKIRDVDVGLSESELIKAVSRTGMTASQWTAEIRDSNQSLVGNIQVLVSGLSGIFLLLALGLKLYSRGQEDGENSWDAHVLFFLFSITFGLALVIPKAWLAARNLKPDMYLLMAVAVVGAVIIGEWFEAAMISFLFSVSLMLESWSVERARKAISKLMELTPVLARRKRTDGTTEEVEASEIEVGELLVIQPGEKIAIDGRIINGSSEVDQATITGESLPVEKNSGDEVFAGTVNGNGLLEIKTTKSADQTVLANIIRLMREAQSKRAQSEKWVEKFARFYTPIVMALALATFLFPPLFDSQWSVWFYRSLVLLVIACPCALVISTPVCIVAGLATAARNGILIKGGVYVEVPATLSAIAMDKTGTLTMGQPSVVEIIPSSSHSDIEVLRRIAALESHSQHPLAGAVLREASRRDLELPIVEQFEIIPGKGACGIIDGVRYWIGSPRLLREMGLEQDLAIPSLSSLQGSGQTLIVLGNEHHACGVITLADKIRPDAINAIEKIHSRGVRPVVLLTGDNLLTAENIGAQAGIDQVFAELLPDEKVTQVERLVEAHGRVAMVGDGINDGPALGRATLGIAMAGIGSDVAIEAADITLISDDLQKIPWLIDHSRKVLGIIRQNIYFALGVKSMLVLLTLIGYSSLWAAVVGDMGTSLVVIFNGLRILEKPTAIQEAG